jgi:RluA family pseudouridine synthase
VHAGGRYIRNTLIAHLRATHSPNLFLAHRLDRETSGVVLLAKHRRAAAHFERELHAGRARKVYLAVLRGAFPAALTVDAPIGRVPSLGPGAEPDPPRWRVLDPPAGKPSVTRFRRLAAGRASAPPRAPVTLVAVEPLTGRTNQIRIHAAHAGHAVLGDKVYGVARELVLECFTKGPTPELLAAAGAPRHLLHAATLVIAHPAGGAPLELSAPVPPDFALSWEEIPLRRALSGPAPIPREDEAP